MRRDINYIVTLYNLGKTPQQIITITGFAKSTVYKHLNGIKTRKYLNIFSSKEEATSYIKNKLNDNISKRKIAKELNVSYMALKYYL